MLRRFVIPAVVLLASACGPRVDGTTVDACTKTLGEVVKRAYGSGDSARFAVAMVELTIGDLRSISNTLGDALTSTASRNRKSVAEPPADSVARRAVFCKAINGLRAGDIMERANKLGAAIADSFDVIQGRAYMNALRTADSRAAVARDSLAAFRVTNAALSQRDGNVGLETTVSLNAENGTKHTVGTAFFNVVATSPGRSAPWYDEEVSYTIRGGIRPGTSASWRFRAAPASGSDASVLIPRDAQISVTPTKLVAPSGEVLWGGARFTGADRKALDSLAAKYK
ncbi:MAG TPA: hypothetical protein VJR92_16065 [Gemmatimonadaceae bacterium]|nr:hypothetical protein [Gemmatimonadaceae bacterium]